jgi:hypothetical protein
VEMRSLLFSSSAKTTYWTSKNRITESFAVIGRTAEQNVLLLLQEPQNRMFCCYCKNRITECFAVIARTA